MAEERGREKEPRSSDIWLQKNGKNGRITSTMSMDIFLSSKRLNDAVEPAISCNVVVLLLLSQVARRPVTTFHSCSSYIHRWCIESSPATSNHRHLIYISSVIVALVLWIECEYNPFILKGDLYPLKMLLCECSPLCMYVSMRMCVCVIRSIWN